MAISTYGVTLEWGTGAETTAKKIDIKNFPDMGGAPDLIEVTTLADPMQVFINGIQSAGAMEFTCNYTKADYEKVKTDANKKLHYALKFGNNGSEGVFKWQGEHSCYVTGADVNAPVEFKISIAPSTKPELSA